MKIDINKYPLLWAIQSGRFLDDGHPIANWNEDQGREMELYRIVQRVDAIWPQMAPRIRANVVYICDTYFDAVERSSKAFNGLFAKDEELRVEFVHSAGSGCYLFPRRDSKSSLTGFVYDFTEEHVFLMVFDNCDTFHAVSCDGEDGTFEFISRCEPQPDEFTGAMYHDLMLYWMMERFAKVETRVVPPGKKGRVTSTRLDQLFNGSRFHVKLRDCSWFTSIIRNEGFMVRGHFRLQPKKNEAGEWTRELIYINEYEKHGYKRNARILNESGTD